MRCYFANVPEMIHPFMLFLSFPIYLFSYTIVFIRLSHYECYAGAECVMKTFLFHPCCLLKTDFPVGEKPFQIIVLKAHSIGHLVQPQFSREAFPPTITPVPGTNRMHFRFVFFAIGRVRVLLEI